MMNRFGRSRQFQIGREGEFCESLGFTIHGYDLTNIRINHHLDLIWKVLNKGDLCIDHWTIVHGYSDDLLYTAPQNGEE